MNLRLMDKYISLCKELDKPITWEGLRHFKKAFQRREILSYE